MFLDNKYTKVYNKIIEKSKNRAIFGYKENHHIVPRCLGGGDKNSMFGRSAPKENNLKWYTNGTKDIYVTEGTQPLGFLR